MVRLAAGRHRSSSPRTRRRSTRTSSTSTSTAAPCPRSGIELRDVVLFWVGHGVKIFRVDNPHTKPIPFWEWLIREVNDRHPDVIFLAEAFTRPKMMKKLAKIGFQQSYTYFTWRNTKQELIAYVTELTGRDGRVLPAELLRQHAGHQPVLSPDQRPAGFIVRGTLAATLSSVYGLYNGFELCEGTPMPGQGGISQLGEIRDQGLGLRPPRQHQGAHPQAQPHPAREPGALGLPQHPLPQRLERPDPVLCAADPREGQLRPRPRQPRSEATARNAPTRCRCGSSACPTTRPSKAEDLLTAAASRSTARRIGSPSTRRERPVVIWRLIPPATSDERRRREPRPFRSSR